MKRKINWVCHECGMKYGRWYQGRVYSGPPKHCATYHMGKCEVCDLTQGLRQVSYIKDASNKINKTL
jgi:hypothetical protein